MAMTPRLTMLVSSNIQCKAQSSTILIPAHHWHPPRNSDIFGLLSKTIGQETDPVEMFFRPQLGIFLVNHILSERTLLTWSILCTNQCLAWMHWLPLEQRYLLTMQRTKLRQWHLLVYQHLMQENWVESKCLDRIERHWIVCRPIFEMVWCLPPEGSSIWSHLKFRRLVLGCLWQRHGTQEQKGVRKTIVNVLALIWGSSATSLHACVLVLDGTFPRWCGGSAVRLLVLVGGRLYDFLFTKSQDRSSMKFSTFFRTFKNPSLKDLEHLVRDPVVQPVNLHPPL